MAKLVLRNVRLSFPDLFEAVQYEGQGPFNYRATFLIPPENPSKKAIDAAMKEVAITKWAGKGEANLKAATTAKKVCFTDGDLVPYNGYAGNWTLVSTRDTSAGRPVVVDRNKAPLTSEDGKFYSGCYVNATVEIWAQDNKFGKGIRATLINVQFVKDGESLGGPAPANDDDLDDLGFEEEDEDLV